MTAQVQILRRACRILGGIKLRLVQAFISIVTGMCDGLQHRRQGSRPSQRGAALLAELFAAESCWCSEALCACCHQPLLRASCSLRTSSTPVRRFRKPRRKTPVCRCVSAAAAMPQLSTAAAVLVTGAHRNNDIPHAKDVQKPMRLPMQASEDLQRASLGLYDDDTGPYPISDPQVQSCHGSVRVNLVSTNA